MQRELIEINGKRFVDVRSAILKSSQQHLPLDRDIKVYQGTGTLHRKLGTPGNSLKTLDELYHKSKIPQTLDGRMKSSSSPGRFIKPKPIILSPPTPSPKQPSRPHHLAYKRPDLLKDIMLKKFGDKGSTVCPIKPRLLPSIDPMETTMYLSTDSFPSQSMEVDENSQGDSFGFCEHEDSDVEDGEVSPVFEVFSNETHLLSPKRVPMKVKQSVIEEKEETASEKNIISIEETERGPPVIAQVYVPKKGRGRPRKYPKEDEVCVATVFGEESTPMLTLPLKRKYKKRKKLDTSFQNVETEQVEPLKDLPEPTNEAHQSLAPIEPEEDNEKDPIPLKKWYIGFQEGSFLIGGKTFGKKILEPIWKRKGDRLMYTRKHNLYQLIGPLNAKKSCNAFDHSSLTKFEDGFPRMWKKYLVEGRRNSSVVEEESDEDGSQSRRKSGRIHIAPLDFWRNERVLDGHVVPGIGDVDPVPLHVKQEEMKKEERVPIQLMKSKETQPKEHKKRKISLKKRTKTPSSLQLRLKRRPLTKSKIPKEKNNRL